MRLARTRARLGRGAWLALLAPALVLAIIGLAGCQARSSGQWQVLGPNDGSIVLAMVRDPTVPQLLYAGTSGGQVYRTRIEAFSVQAGKGIPASAAVPALVADPRARGTLFAGTSRGVYYTSDYGDTWQPRGTGLPAGDAAQSLALIAGPGAATTLYAGTDQHDVYISTDGGNTWTADSAGMPAGANVYALTYDGSTGTLYAALAGGGGVFALPSGAATWVARASGLPPTSDIYAMLPLAPAPGAGSGETLYAGTSKGLFASADGGQTWHAAGLGSSRVLALAADPTEAGALYAGTESTIYRTADGGRTWTPEPAGIDHSVAAIVVLTGSNHQPVVFAASGGSILRYPPRAAGAAGPASTFIPLVLTLLVLGVLYYYSRRNLRYLRTRFADRPSERKPPPGGPAAEADHGDDGDGAKWNGNGPSRRPLSRG